MNLSKLIIKFTIILVVLNIGLCSCSKGDDDEKTETATIPLSVSTTSVTLEPSKPITVTVKVETGKNWEISFPAQYWYTVSPTSGTGTQNITIVPSSSTYREKQNASKITVILNDSTVTVSKRFAYITVTGQPNNTKPTATSKAIYPENNATNITDGLMRFQWADATDPDGDRISYIIEYSKDQSTWTKIQGLTSSTYSSTSKLEPNTKYYWRVTTTDMFGATSDVSTTFNFTTAASANAWSDEEARLYQNNTNGDEAGFTLVVSGDGFTASDMTAGGNWYATSSHAIESLFENIEPYRTYRKYFRIYRVAGISEESGISEHQPGNTQGICNKVVNTKYGTMYDNTSSSAWCGLFDKRGGTNKNFEDVKNVINNALSKIGVTLNPQKSAIVIIMNIAHYNGTVNYFESSKTAMGFLCTCPGTIGSQTAFENVFCHEIGGHAIGKLADLYATSPTATITNERKKQTQKYQEMGWYQNVDVSGNKEQCPWSIIIKSKEHDIYYPATGYYEGARSVGHGIWRSESNATCMNDNRFYYDAASRYCIIKMLKENAGETLTWEEFVNTDYDRSNVNVSTKSMILSNVIPLPEPVIWK